ncbi:MAG: GAF domain-containing sensor histidine kinase [Bacteroidota bacterium]
MDQEVDRLQDISSFALSYENYHDELQPFVKLGKEITESPVCEINIIDAYNQWTIARTKKELKVIPREESVCFDTIQQDEPYEISDLSQSDRYQNRSYVTGDPNFRYYCGVQLTTRDGNNIGSICVLDQKAKEISNQQKTKLQHLADLVVPYLEKDRLVYQSKKQVHQMREQFRTLNHDLRNPINGIVGIADLLITDEATVEVDRDDLLTIKDCAEAIVDEIDGTLLASDERVTNGADSVLLNTVFEKLASLSTPQAQNKNIEFTISGDAQIDSSISVYSSKRLIQILSNLVANAIKFTKSGGCVEAKYSMAEDNEDSFLKVEVVDDGVGMDSKEVDRFNNGEKVTGLAGTEGEVSYGIGLHHVRNLVSELGGSIEVESTKNEGTRFTVMVALANL